MKIEERKGMKIITADKGKLLRNTQTGAITSKIYAPPGVDLSVYEEFYKDKDSEDIYEEIERLNSSDIDIQLALVELFDIFAMFLGGE